MPPTDLMKRSPDSATTTNSPVNVKLLLIGNASVGKSSLLLRFSDEQWLPEDEATATIGVDFRVRCFLAFMLCADVCGLIGSQDGSERAEGEAQYMGAFILSESFPCNCGLTNDVCVFCRIQLAKNASAQSHPRTIAVLKGSYLVRPHAR
jgi:hypothetical protein